MTTIASPWLGGLYRLPRFGIDYLMQFRTPRDGLPESSAFSQMKKRGARTGLTLPSPDGPFTQRASADSMRPETSYLGLRGRARAS